MKNGWCGSLKSYLYYGVKCLLLWCLLAQQQSYAGCHVKHKNQTVNINITVPPNSPVGTILYSGAFAVDPSEIYAWCDENGGKIARWIRDVPNSGGELHPVRDVAGHVIEGLGIRFIDWTGQTVNRSSSPILEEIYQQGEVKFLDSGPVKDIQFEFIKTGTIKPGTKDIKLAPFVIAGYDNMGRFSYVGRQYEILVGTFIVKPTCQLQHPDHVDLGKTPSHALNSASSIKDFKIDVICSGDAQLELEMHSPHVDSEQDGVLRNVLENGAQGVGVQILADGAPIKFNTQVSFQYATPNQPKSFAYQARLYKTNQKITPGSVQTYVNIILKYQ